MTFYSDIRKLESNIKKFHKNDIVCRYYADFDYDSSRNCSDYGCDQICRCSQIDNIRLDHIYYDSFISDFNKGIKDKILLYCIQQVVYKSGLNEDSFPIHAVGGYYGQELSDDKILDADKLRLIENMKNLLFIKNNSDRIKYVLELEYGYIIDSIKELSNLEVKNVKFSDIQIGNKDYSNKIDKSKLKSYESYTGIRGICIKSANSFRLIDGYHRVLSANKSKNFEVIVLS